MIRKEHRRLNRAFTAILYAIAPTVAVGACATTAPTGGAASDASIPPPESGSPDSAADTDAGADVAADPTDAGVVSPDAPQQCGMTTTIREAGPDSAPDADLGCEYALRCGLPSGLSLIGCEVYVTGPDGGPIDTPPLGCRLREGAGCEDGGYRPGDGGAITLECADCLGGGGRRTSGIAKIRAARCDRRSAIGGYFARMAHDEAASVHAFLRMRDELAAHGAPASLARACERAASDEVRHARAMADLAVAEGARAPKPRVRRPRGARSLEAIARENAVEGCVHETFNALVARWQAEHASEPSVRRTFARLAADEERHAALAWAVARWSERQLDEPARRRVRAARTRAVRSLERATHARAPSPFEARVGRPDRVEAARLLGGMIDALDLG